MKTMVIGGGLIGLTTAYHLRCHGHDVEVIDRREGVGLETSFANGAVLHPSMPEPWNAPGCWRVLLASLFRPQAAMQLRFRAIPDLAQWGIQFFRNSNESIYNRNTLSNLRLGIYSLNVMRTLRTDTDVEYGRIARGSLRVFRDRAAFERAFALASQRSSEGLSFRRLSKSEIRTVEPALEPIAANLAGALYYEGDEIGNAHHFCQALAKHLRRQGVDFRFCTDVLSLDIAAGQVIAAVTAEERFVADHYVVAAGSHSTRLLSRLGLRLPVKPVKGYSVTFDNCRDQGSLEIPVVDDQLHAAVVPVDNAIRVAGTAEFSGYDLTLHPNRISNLLGLLREILPNQRLDFAAAKPWCGLRPMSADGVPIIGPSPISNLWINTGHGHLGWTLAAGSAKLLSDQMCGDTPSMARFR